MTVQQMFNALPILQRLMELRLPVKKAYETYNLIKVIEEKRDFITKEEQKLIQKFNCEITEKNQLKFQSQEDQINFINEHNDLINFEIDIQGVELNFNDLKDVEFTPIEMAQIEGIIKFI